MPIVIGYIGQFFPQKEYKYIDHNQLMSTIRFPNNLKYLGDNLPQPEYEVKFVIYN